MLDSSLPVNTRQVESILRKWWPLIYLVTVGGILWSGFSDRAYDDPFITYRYAENIAQGVGFVYNPGERVLSTTTPLFALLLAIPSLAGFDVHLVATGIGALSLAVGALFIWDLSRTWGTPLVGWAALLLYPTFPLLVATVGSETPFYLALCLGGFAFYAKGRYWLAALCVGLAVLARPDGALVALLLAIDFINRRPTHIPWGAVILFYLITLSWVLFAWAYFGSPVPVTLLAKQRQGAMAISQQFAAGFLTILGGYSSWNYVLEGALALLGLVYSLLRRRAWILFFAWTGLYFVSFTLLGVSRYFWYYAPLVPGFVVAVGLGIFASSSAFDRQGSTRSLEGTGAMGILAVVLIGVFTLAQGASVWRLQHQANDRYAIYRAIGEWLEVNSQPEDRIGALEVGIIGYYSGRPMIDFAGLLQPQVANQLSSLKTYEDSALWAIDQFSPEYVVLQDGFFTPRNEGLIRESCVPARVFNGEDYGFQGNFQVYACR